MSFKVVFFSSFLVFNFCCWKPQHSTCWVSSNCTTFLFNMYNSWKKFQNWFFSIKCGLSLSESNLNESNCIVAPATRRLKVGQITERQNIFDCKRLVINQVLIKEQVRINWLNTIQFFATESNKEIKLNYLP